MPQWSSTLENERSVIRFVRAYHSEQGYWPTVREIGEHMNWRSPATVHRYLLTLESKGRMRRVAISAGKIAWAPSDE